MREQVELEPKSLESANDWQDEPRTSQRFARGSIPPRELSVSFAPRKPTTLQMAVPPMPELRPSGSVIAALADLAPPRAERASDLDVVAPRRKRRWTLLAIATAASLAIGAGSAYAFYGRRPAPEVDTSALRIAVPGVEVAEGPRVAAQQARDAVLGQIAEVDRAIAGERRAGAAVHALRAQLEARRRELAGVKQLAAACEPRDAAPAPDPFSRSTRSEDPRAEMLAQRHAELARRASRLAAQVRTLEAQLVDAGTGVAVDRLTAQRAELVASLEQHERALQAAPGEPRPIARIALDQVPATGTRVFSCRIVCRAAGEVSAIREGEIDFDHPSRGRIRGRLVELRLSAPVTSDVLFLGAAPF